MDYYDDGEEHYFDVDESLEARRKKDEARKAAGALSAEAIERNRRLDASKKGQVKRVDAVFLGKGAATVGPGTMTEKADLKDGAGCTSFPRAR